MARGKYLSLEDRTLGVLDQLAAEKIAFLAPAKAMECISVQFLS